MTHTFPFLLIIQIHNPIRAKVKESLQEASEKYFLTLKQWRDFPGGPVVKTSSSNAGAMCSIPGWGAKTPHTSQPKSQNLKQKQYCNKFNKDFKNNPHQKKLFKKVQQRAFLLFFAYFSMTTFIFFLPIVAFFTHIRDIKLIRYDSSFALI